MMNEFYYDRISIGLSEIEKALKLLRYGDAAAAAESLSEVRDLVDTIYRPSKHTSHFWVDQIPDDWLDRPAQINPDTGRPYSYVDLWAFRYERMRREIVQKLEAGYTIELVPPRTPTT